MPILDWASSSRARPGETVSGDACMVRFYPHGGALVAVMDGLGHGPEAAEASARAVSLMQNAAAESVIALTRRCHGALQGSRGLCLSLASFDERENTMTWMGVGNIEAMLVRTDAEREHLLLRAGVVGHHLPRLQATMLPVHAGDMLIMYTDGIRMQYTDPIGPQDAALDRIAQAMLRRYAVQAPAADDALLVVARYQGAS